MVRVGLVGCGRIMQEGHLPALQRLGERVEIVALADPSPERRAVIGDLAGIAADQRYSAVDELLGRARIDLLDVAVPHFLHEPAVLAAAAAGVDVVLEKPIATTLDECDRMIAAVTAAGTRLAVIHNYAYRPPEARALALIAEGAIGRPFLVRSEGLGGGHYKGATGYDPDWRTRAARSGGGCLIDNAYHNIYLAWKMLQAPVERVYARLGTYVQPIEVEDTALLLMEHAGGATSSIQVSWAVRAGGLPVHEVHGTAGSIAFRRDGHALSLYRDATGAWEHLDLETDLGFPGYFAALIGALEAGQPIPVDFTEARRNLAIVRAAYASAEAGQPVAPAG